MTAFARHTGDIAVLSATDLAVLALALTVEVEANGWHRVRESPGKPSQEELENPPAPKSKAKRQRRPKPVKPAAPPAEPAAAVKDDATMPDDVSASLAKLHVADKADERGEQAGTSESESESDDEDAGDWITPSNVGAHKAHDLGLFDSLEPGDAEAPAQPLACACITGDFAMQNVLIQMGLDVIGVGGKRVSEVRTWVLRCHGCFRCVRALSPHNTG